MLRDLTTVTIGRLTAFSFGLAGYAQVNLPEGFEVVATGGPFSWYAHPPKMNDCGQIVYIAINPDKQLSTDLFLYDNDKAFQLTFDDIEDRTPKITGNRVVVWDRDEDNGRNYVLTMRSRGEMSFLGIGNDVRMNLRGQSVWAFFTSQGCREADADIFLNGKAITYGGLNNQSATINRHGHVAWTAYNECVDPWTSEINFLAGGGPIAVPTGQENPQIPDLNDHDLISWGSQNGIQTWDGQTVTTITDWGRNTYLNNDGDIMFLRFYDDDRTWEVWLYGHTGEFYRITDDPWPYWNTDGDINDYGEIAWVRYDFFVTGTSEFRLMRRIRTGEADFDGDVDLKDYTEAARCLDGPDFLERYRTDPTDTLCDCRFLDLDHDNDVDLRDMARFQNAFGLKP